MGSLDETVRSETIERLKLRDQVLAVYATLVSGAIGAAINGRVSTVLLVIPGLSLALTLLSAHHDMVLEHLHEYLKNQGVGWETSRELQRYRDGFGWIRTTAQLLIFGGSSIAALVANYRLACQWPAGVGLSVVWWLGTAFTTLVLVVITVIRLKRHRI